MERGERIKLQMTAAELTHTHWARRLRNSSGYIRERERQTDRETER